jgi:hypothetical protein
MGRKAKTLLGLEPEGSEGSTFGNRREASVERELRTAHARIARQQEKIEKLRKRLSDGGQRRSRGPRMRSVGTPVFFVVGQGKSGTGWLRKMLDSHPEVLCRGEGRFFGREKRNEELIEAKAGNRVVQRKVAPGSLYNALAESEFLRLWVERSVWSQRDDTEEQLDDLTRLAADYFLLKELAKTTKKLVGDKTPLFGPDDLMEISTIYPGARTIHIMRDGRDQAVSRMHHAWNKSTDQGGVERLSPGEVSKRNAFFADRQAFLESGEGIFEEERLRSIASKWRENVASASRYGRELLAENYAEVRYEDLLKDTEQEATRLFSFLGVDTSPRVVLECTRAASFEASAGRKRGSEDYALGWRKHRKGIAGDWKNVFTERDKEVFKEEAGHLLVTLGYEKDANW